MVSMRTFYIVAIGQIVSLVGSKLTGFALGVWIYQVSSGSVTQYAISNFLVSFPSLLISPFAGIIVDKFDRRKVMIFSDIGSILTTLFVYWKLSQGEGNLEVWHINICNIISGVFHAFQSPAFQASISQLVEKDKLVHSNSIIEMGVGIGELVCPALSGILMHLIGIDGIIMIDMITLLFAEFTLMIVRFPPVKVSEEGKAADKIQGISDLFFGLKYIYSHSGLFALLILFACSNIAGAFITVLMPPMLLNVSTVTEFGLASSFAGCGFLVGSILVAIYNTPEDKIKCIVLSLLIQGICMLSAFTAINLYIIGSVGFIFFTFEPIIGATSNAIWQTIVPQDIQGRVFSFRSIIAMAPMPIVQLIAGPLADYVFEPLMASNGPMEGTLLGKIIGIGIGRGICFIFILDAFFLILCSIIAFQYKPLRYLEKGKEEITKKQN